MVKLPASNLACGKGLCCYCKGGNSYGKGQ